MQWAVDTEAVEVARELLELDLPVRIIVEHPPEDHFDGKYVGTGNDGHHHVYVSPELDYSVASFVIWHELAHAAQAERIFHALDPDAPVGKGGALERFVDEWLAGMAALGITLEQLRSGDYDDEAYARNPLEVEANRVADMANDRVPLTVPLRATESAEDDVFFDAMDRALGADR